MSSKVSHLSPQPRYPIFEHNMVSQCGNRVQGSLLNPAASSEARAGLAPSLPGPGGALLLSCLDLFSPIGGLSIHPTSCLHACMLCTPRGSRPARVPGRRIELILSFPVQTLTTIFDLLELSSTNNLSITRAAVKELRASYCMEWSLVVVVFFLMAQQTSPPGVIGRGISRFSSSLMA